MPNHSMLYTVLQFGLTAFVTMLVIVDPLGMLPLFTALTTGMSLPERRGVLRRAIVTAFAIAVFFLLVGDAALRYMGVSVHAFAISGGILLFATALPMLFGQRGGLQSPQQEEQGNPAPDVAIFPLAIPLLTGPGLMTSLLLLTAQTHGQATLAGALFAATVLVFALAWIVMWLGERVMARIGQAGAHVATRVLGVALAALAVQFVLNGFTGYYHALVGR